MGKKDITYNIVSYGRYSKWERDSKDIPKIMEFTDTVKAEVDNEFGFVLNIKKGKGKRLDFLIDHPDFIDQKTGKIIEPFEGEYYIGSNDFDFFIGDCIWEPAHDKTGDWYIAVFYEKKVIAEKTFKVVP